MAPAVLESLIIKSKQVWDLSERRKNTGLCHAYQVLPGRDAALIQSAAQPALPTSDLVGFVPGSHLEIANVSRRL